MSYLLSSARVGLRNWRASDLDEFAQMNADPEVMRFFPNRFDRETTNLQLKKLQSHFDEYGYTYFCAEEIATQAFLGFVGLLNQTYESPFTPCVDIGWRLKKEHWGKGFAPEAAKACLDYAFEKLQLSEVYAVAPLLNEPSARVMQKIGMQKHLVFGHPKIADESPLKQCVVYRIGREE